MLKTQPVTEAAPPTSQEIAQAIAALEARSATHTDTSSQTVAVGEVIRNLGLDMTPEDVLAEVQAQRERRQRLGTRLPMRTKRIMAFVAGCTFVILCVIGQRLDTVEQAPAPDTTSVQTVYEEPSPPAHLHIAQDALVQDRAGHVTTLRTWAEIPDNHPVQSYKIGTDFSMGQDGDAPNAYQLWTLVKHHGKAYVRCLSIPMSAQAMQKVSQGSGISLYSAGGGTSTASAGNVRAYTPLTLALGNIVLRQSDPDGDMEGPMEALHAASVRLDSYAHEKWQP